MVLTSSPGGLPMTMAPEERTALGSQSLPFAEENGGIPGPDGAASPEYYGQGGFEQVLPRKPWLRRRWRTIVALLVVVALAVGAGIYFLGGGSSSTTYRTEAATIGDVRETTSATGTIEPATQATVNFAVAGTVNSVRVSVGQVVKAGAVLATVQTPTLQSDVEQAQATLGTDEAKMASDQMDQTVMQAQDSVANAQLTVSQDQESVTNTQSSNAMALTQAKQAVSQAETQLADDKTAGQQSIRQAQTQLANDTAQGEPNITAAQTQLATD